MGSNDLLQAVMRAVGSPILGGGAYMSTSSLFGITGQSYVRTSVGAATASQSRTSSTGAGKLTIAQARDQVRAAASAFVAAFLELTSETKPFFTSSVFTGMASPARVKGQAVRLLPVLGTSSALYTTQKINTQT